MAYSGAFGLARQKREESPPPAAPQPQPSAAPGTEEKMPLSIHGLLKKVEAAGMETDDLLMALILYLMYRESGDKDLLIMLGAMLLS